MQRQGSDMEEKTCYVYLLRCEGGSLYAGITSDPERRLRQHRSLEKGGAKYTRGHPPLGYACVWQAANRSAALRLEAYLKRQSHQAKEALCAAADTIVRNEDEYLCRRDLRTADSLLY